MGETVSSKGEAVSSAPHESPLVPNRKMKRMYEGIAESRMLEDLLRKRHKKMKHSSAHGQEACRISALIDLDPEDLTSDAPARIETAFLRGVALESIVSYADVLASGKKKEIAAARLSLPGLLPPVEDTADRVQLAMGAALTLKRLKLPRVLLLFLSAQDFKLSAWKKTLRFAAQEVLPLLFVVLPESAKTSGKSPEPFELSALATATGVPGIPVDASDAVALYRVAQESIGRARAGGGPALMECLQFVIEEEKKGGRKKAVADPLAMMGKTLLDRKVCDRQWLADVSTAFKTRLSAL